MTGLKGVVNGRMSCQKMLRMKKISVEFRDAQGRDRREILQMLVSTHNPHPASQFS